MKPKNLILLAALVVAMGAGPALHGQETNAAAPRNPPDRPFRPARLFEGPIAGMLTPEQRASIQQVVQAEREKLIELETKIRDARRAMFTTGLNGTFDEDAVRKQALVLASLEAEMSVLRVKVLSQIRPPLSLEQIETLKNAAPAAPPGGRPLERPAGGRRRILQNENRDANDLPPKQ